MAQVKIFEDVPDYCEAYTLHIHNKLAIMISSMHIDCFEVANFHWFTVGYQNANQRNKWCQEKGKNDTTRFKKAQKEKHEHLF